MCSKEQEQFIEKYRDVLISCCNRVLDNQWGVIDDAVLVGEEKLSDEASMSIEELRKQAAETEAIRRKITKKEKLTILEYNRTLIIVITAAYSIEIYIEYLEEAHKNIVALLEEMQGKEEKEGKEVKNIE